MAVLVTGVAGFIGFHVARALLDRGEEVIGVDIVNAYYDPALKEARLRQIEGCDGYRFVKADIAELAQIQAIAQEHAGRITGVVHLAAQAGVRHSLTAPFDYVRANLVGHMVMLEVARHHLPELQSFVYASSSSVYGGNDKTPFAVDDPVERPVSLYAATKRADELMSYAYAHLYRIPQTGLRFFTVYGPWGRPDMAAYIFADAIAKGRPITLFNHGQMQRDFTYIDDIVAGILGVLDRPPGTEAGPPHRIVNIGNNHPETLRRFVSLLEQNLGRKARVIPAPMQPGDVPHTYADIEPMRALCGFSPKTPLEIGIARFAEWFLAYRGFGHADHDTEPNGYAAAAE
jgi:UDP-glucuronate 4-epimerase